MTHIKQTEIIPPHLIVAAKCYHQSSSNERIRVPRMYTVSDKPDGRGMQVYMLTRYVNHLGVAMSSILKVQPDETLKEICRDDRKHEEQMILAWCTQIGGAECEPQNMT